MLLGCLAATTYFAYHAVNGTHGLLAKNRLTSQSSMLARDIAGLEIVRDRLQRDVAALGTDPPHPDIVEEVARSVLGYSRPGDIAVRDWTVRDRR
ncbi:MAG: septum formation initiator family protein [Hyphomicrobiaceae bacterium]